MTSKTRVLVFGHYGHSSIGDQLFIPAFQHLFPEFELTFTDRITTQSLTDMDAVFIGGGSFLGDKPAIDDNVLPLLQQHKLFYLGVGTETDIHPLHQQLMQQAMLIATRTPINHNKAQSLNANTIYTPDLVFALQDQVVQSPKKSNKSVLVLPNIYLVPRWNDPSWLSASWFYFANEFAQFLDVLAEQDHNIEFFAMSQHHQMHDDGATNELINRMQHRDRAYILHSLGKETINSLTSLFSQHATIITQRFHGIVLAEMTQTPYMVIHHHDKLKLCQPSNGSFVPYYGLSKDILLEQFNQAQQTVFSPQSANSFALMQEKVHQLIG